MVYILTPTALFCDRSLTPGSLEQTDLNTAEFWRGYPFTEMTRDMKLYYLLQFSFWLHQLIIVVLKIEKPRKDYYQLVVHVSSPSSPSLPPFSS